MVRKSLHTLLMALTLVAAVFTVVVNCQLHSSLVHAEATLSTVLNELNLDQGGYDD